MHIPHLYQPFRRHRAARIVGRTAMVLVTTWTCVVACGGGWAPMVFTSGTDAQKTGETGGKAAKTDFYTDDRGVTVDLFNDRKLQPIIQSILLRGNKRVRRDNSQTRDSTIVAQKDSTAARSEPDKSDKVLNIKNLH